MSESRNDRERNGLFEGRKEEKRTIREMLERGLQKKRLLKVTTVLACMVVFITTYAMILPAISVEQSEAGKMPGFLKSIADGLGISDAAAQRLEDQNINENDLSGCILKIQGEDPSETRLAVIVRTDAETEKEASVFVVERDPKEGVKLTEVSLEDPAISVLGREEAADYPEMETEVKALLQDAQAELVLAPDEAEVLTGNVENSLAALKGENVEAPSAQELQEDSGAAPQESNDVTQSEGKEPVEDSLVAARENSEDPSVQASQGDKEQPAQDNKEQAPENENKAPAVAAVSDGIDEVAGGLLQGRVLQQTAEGVTVTARWEDGVFPEGVEMTVQAVDQEPYAGLAQETLGESQEKIRPLDISFVKDGQEVEPAGNVKITFRADFIDKNVSPEVLHINGDGEAEVVPSRVVNDQISLTTDHFSVYVIRYTVDFEYSVNGKMYQFSLPGGGFVSFTDLVEVLGIIGDTNAEENGDESGDVITENGEENGINEGAEKDGINSDTNTALTLGDVEVSEATRKFVANVANVEFSSPELVDVSKVENETTVGQIKESRGLHVEYSADLMEE